MVRRFSEPVNRGILSFLPALPRSEFVDALEAYDLGLVWHPLIGRGPLARFTCAPNKVGEYLAAGLGVIHTGNTGLGFLDKSGAAIGVDPSDPDSLAGLCRSLANDPSRVNLMRERARKLHSDCLNLEEQAAPLLAWLSQIRSSLRS